MKLFSLRQSVDNGSRSLAASRAIVLSSTEAWRIVRSGTPWRPRGGPLSSPRENSIHQSSCQTKSLDKEGEKSTNEKVRIAEEDKVGQKGRPSGTVCVRCEREKNLLSRREGNKRIKIPLSQNKLFKSKRNRTKKGIN